jgi:acetyl-CoA acetyltransferase
MAFAYICEDVRTPIGRYAGALAQVRTDDLAAHALITLRLKFEKNSDLLELNEAFAAQTLAVTRAFHLPDDSDKVNPNGGAIALGHPLGMSGARLVVTASRQLQCNRGRYAMASMCVGVGQGMAILLERV